MKKLIFFFLLFVNIAQASETVNVCATYLGTVKKYKVQAQQYSGSELNTATRSFDYSSLSKYVVIFWGSNQASIIELDSFGVGIYAKQGKDQNGYLWEVSTSVTFCN